MATVRTTTSSSRRRLRQLMASEAAPHQSRRASPPSPQAPPPSSGRAPLILRGGATAGRTAIGGTTIERSMISVESIAIFSVKPAALEQAADSAKKGKVFAVHVQNAITGRSWVVYRAYEDFLILRQLIQDHFRVFEDDFPRLRDIVKDIYFPRPHRFIAGMNKIVEHRCEAFHKYLVMLHRVLISQDYLPRREISEIGLSVLRGFIGSSRVQNKDHAAYSMQQPVRAGHLPLSDRLPVQQCGSLETVIEVDHDDNQEDDKQTGRNKKEVETRGESPSSTADELTDGTDKELSSSSDEEEELSESDEPEIDTAAAQPAKRRFGRTRKSLITFLKRDSLIG